MKKVILSEALDQTGPNLLREHGYKVEIAKGTDVESMKESLKDAHAVIMRSSLLPAEVIDAAPKLRIIARNGTGINNIDVEEATKKHILLAKVDGANSNGVAEYVISMMLLLSRNFLTDDKLVKANKDTLQKTGSMPNFTTLHNLNGHELKGKTLGIIGVGHIGSIVARLARALGMNVLAYDPYLPQEIDVKLVHKLDTMLPKLDFLSINAPFTKETKNMISSKQIKELKKSTILINSARGGIVNEYDLAAALNKGLIKAAAIDSYNPEPPASDNPLFSAKNVIMTSHMAGTSIEANKTMSKKCAEAIIDYDHGKLPEFTVNPQVMNK